MGDGLQVHRERAVRHRHACGPVGGAGACHPPVGRRGHTGGGGRGGDGAGGGAAGAQPVHRRGRAETELRGAVRERG